MVWQAPVYFTLYWLHGGQHSLIIYKVSSPPQLNLGVMGPLPKWLGAWGIPKMAGDGQAGGGDQKLGVRAYPFPKSNSKVGGESVSPLAFSPWMSVSISQIKFKSGWWKCLSLGIQSMDVCIPFPSQIQKWEVKVFLSWHLAHGCLYPFPKLNSKVGGG